jgi:hypothetical protein
MTGTRCGSVATYTAVIVAILGLTGCDGGQKAAPQATGPTTATSNASGTGTSTPAADPTSKGPEPSSVTSTLSSASPTISHQSPLGRCLVSHLSASIQRENGSGAAGSYEVQVVITNTASHTCLVNGYPGVSFAAGDKHTQLGAAARRDGTVTPHTVTLGPRRHAYATLGPRRHAYATLGVSQAGAFGSRCTVTKAAGFRVYPPRETRSLFAPSSAMACTNRDIGLLTIFPFSESVQQH